MDRLSYISAMMFSAMLSLAIIVSSAGSSLAAGYDDLVRNSVEVVPVTGEPTKISSIQLNDDVLSGTELGKNQKTTWPMKSLISIQTGNAPAAPGRFRAWMNSGETISFADLTSFSEDKIDVRGFSFEKLTLAPNELRGLLLAEVTAEVLERAHKWVNTPRTGDAVLYRNFDESVGLLTDISEKFIVWKVGVAERRAPRDQILAVSFDPQLAETPKLDNYYLVVQSTDGGKIFARTLTYDDTTKPKWAAVRLNGQKIQLQSQALVSLSVRNGDAVYLSDLPALRMRTEPFLDFGRKVAFDRNAMDRPLRLGGRTAEKGIGAVSRSSLVYSTKQWKQFQATVGVDDEAGENSSLRFVVKVDGKPRFDSGEMRVGDSPKAVALTLDGSTEIELFVDYEKRGDVDDLANWAEARFVR